MMERYYQEHRFPYICWLIYGEYSLLWDKDGSEKFIILFRNEEKKASMEQSWKSKYNLNNEEKWSKIFHL